MKHKSKKAITQVLVLYVCIGLAACTSMQPVNFSPEVLRKELAAGNLIRPGDHLRITTAQGEKRDLKVRSITHEALLGEDVEVLFTDIVSIEIRQFSTSRTGALAGGVMVGYIALVTVALSSLAFVP